MTGSGATPDREVPFVETSVATHMFRVFDHARDIGWNAAIVGPPGVGKSFIAREYARSRRHTVFVDLTEAKATSYRGALKAMLDLRPWEDRTDIYSLERRFFKYDYHKYLFIIDEAQTLKLNVLRALLHLSVQDGGQLAFAFCGNEELLKHVNTSEGAFAQISRRVQFREDIEGISDEDADLLANAYGVEGMDAYRLCRSIGSSFHADGITTTLTQAREYAGRSPINVEHVRSALDVLPQYRPREMKKRGRNVRTAAYRVNP